MFGTLFFDEARVGTALRVRQTRQQATAATSPVGSRLHPNRGDARAAGQRCAFGCRGEVALPSLCASLLWWLDAEASVVQLLVVNDSASSRDARASQSRLLSVEVPTTRPGQLVTCGVTRNYIGDNGVAVVWVLSGDSVVVAGEESSDASQQRGPASCLTAGFAQVTVQRAIDKTGHSSLLLIPGEKMVECAPLSRIPGESFTPSEAGCRASACVVAELPQSSTARTASIVVLTDGARLWCAELFADGSVSVATLTDDVQRRNVLRSFCDANAEVRLLDTRTVAADLQRLASPAPAEEEGDGVEVAAAPLGTRWLRRFLSTSGPAGRNNNNSSSNSGSGSEDGLPALDLPPALRRRLYTAVSAVQQSPFVALTRWNGQVEVYEVSCGAMRLASQYPIGVVPPALLTPVAAGRHNTPYALPAGPTMQWATRNPTTQLLHVVTCLADRGEGRPCLWTALPLLPPPPALDGAVQGRAGEILAQYCTVTVVAPTLSSRALACAVSGDGSRLVVVSDIGCEEDAHLLCARSLAALTLPEAQMKSEGVGTLVQVVEAEGDGGLQGLLRTGRLHAYLCQGAHMQGVVARGGAVVMIEQGVQPCRLFTLEDAAEDALVQLTESVVVGVEAEDVQGGAESDEGQNAVAVVDGQSSGDALSSPHCVHYIPLIETNPFASAGGEAAAAADPLAVYWEGVSVIRSCAHGARFMAALLRDVLQSSSPVAELASLPRFLSEAHLSGYTASLQRSASSTQSSALAAVRLALSPASAAGVPCTAQEFYTYSRLYATEAAMGKVLSRVTFLATAYLGWQSTQSVACAPAPHHAASQKDATAPSTEWVTQQMVTALEVLVAAYHALPLAGPDAARLARVEDSAATQPTADAMVAALLPVFTPSSQSEPSSSRSASEVSAAAVVQVVNRLRRCGTPRTARACAAWVKQLTRRFPLLQHFQLLSLLETAAAPAQSARVQACCEAVCHALAREPTAAVVELLFAEDFFLADAVATNGSGSAFHAVPSDELAAFVAAAPAVGPKLYAVGVLRRVTALGALFCTLNTSVTRGYLYATLMLCDEWAERLQRRAAASEQAPPFQRLRHAFAELRVDALLTSAQARVAQADMAGCFHDLQAALDLMPAQRCLPTYAEVVQRVVGTAVEVACASQANMRALLTATTIGAAQLEESLILKWYNYIARLPTKSASEATEALRYRAILGLHRYLMNHHSYAQCARLMSSLATLLRCSPLRRTAISGIAVSELAGLALHAATLIAPAVPMPEENRTSMTGTLVADAAGAEGHAASAAAAAAAVAAGSPLSLGYSWRPSSISSSSPQPIDPTGTDAAEVGGGAARWLTRADIPWLQRRLFQAQCERQLWRRGCTLDCTDLWVEGAPVDAVRLGVEKLVSALMQQRLWPQAFRFARLSELYDPCTVLEEWALDLLRSAQRSRKNSGSGSGAADTADTEAHAADRAEAWEEIVSYCRELSTLANQFTPFVRTVTTALTFSYEDVPSDLLAAHRQTDAYTAMSALFQVALVLRKRADTAAAVGAMDGMEVEDGNEDEERSAGGGEGLNGATPSVSSAASQPGGSGADNALTRKRDAADTAAAVAATRLNVWRALSAAARIAQELLQQQQQQQSGISHGMRMGGFAAEEEEQRAVGPRQAGSVVAARGVFSSFTAGVIDPMVVCANELMAAPVYRAGLPSVPGVQLNLERFLNSVSAVRA